MVDFPRAKLRKGNLLPSSNFLSCSRSPGDFSQNFVNTCATCVAVVFMRVNICGNRLESHPNVFHRTRTLVFIFKSLVPCLWLRIEVTLVVKINKNHLMDWNRQSQPFPLTIAYATTCWANQRLGVVNLGQLYIFTAGHEHCMMRNKLRYFLFVSQMLLYHFSPIPKSHSKSEVPLFAKPVNKASSEWLFALCISS